MEILDILKQNAVSSRRDKKISLLAKIKEHQLLKKIAKIIDCFVTVAAMFDYDFSDTEKGFYSYFEHLVTEAKTSQTWEHTTYTANAMGAAYFFAFLIIENFPNSFNFKEVKGHWPFLDYVGDATNLEISFNLTQTMYDILKGDRDISKLDTIYALCEALHNGTVTEETIDDYLENPT
jgi:hypothetical protein